MHSDPPALRAVAEAQDLVLTRAQALTAGLSAEQITRRLRTRQWAALCRGVYLLPDDDGYRPTLDSLPERVAYRAALLVGGAQAVLAHRAAAILHGLPAPYDTSMTVDVLLPRHRRPPQPRGHPGPVRPHWRWRPLTAEDVVQVQGLPCTSVTRTVGDLLTTANRTDALCLLDAAARLDPAGLEAWLPGASRGKSPRSRKLRSLTPLLDGRSESPLETRVRLILIDAGLAPDALQHPVLDRDGRLLARADMVWIRGGLQLIVECDGAAFHDGLKPLHHDRRRQNDLILRGYHVARFTWRDSESPAYIRGVVRRALANMTN